jgi:4-amino-4-deoxy-L-arabinose transferase-like glycosyltransferase
MKKLLNSRNGTIAIILAIAFFVRALIPLLAYGMTGDATAFHGYDTHSYLEPARSLIESGQFASSGRPEIFRTPGYSVFLIPGLLLDRVEFMTIAFQVLLGCVTVYLIYRLVLILFENRTVALLGAILCALEPMSAIWSSFLLSETLFTTLILAFLYYLVRYIKRRSLQNILLATLFLTISIYVRPIGYYLPILISIFLLLGTLMTRQFNRSLIPHLAIFLIATMGSVGLWQIRNAITTGYSFFAAVADHNLYCYNAAALLAHQRDRPFFDTSAQLCGRGVFDYFEIHPEQRDWTQAQIYRYQGRAGKELIASDPINYAIVHFQALFKTLVSSTGRRYVQLFTDRRESEFSDRIHWLLSVKTPNPLLAWGLVAIHFIDIAFYSLLYLFSIRAWFSKPAIANLSGLAVLSVTTYLIILTAPPGSERFRVPIMPILCGFAAYGLWLTFHQWRDRADANTES